jgi:hypothetical protein
MAADVPVHEFLSAGYRIAGNLLRGELYRSGRVERQVKKKRRAASPAQIAQGPVVCRLAAGGRGTRTSGPTFKQDCCTPSSPFVFWHPAAPAAIVLISRERTTSSSRHPKVISLVEPREETCDGKAER